jgi:ribosomal protein S27AE
MHTWGTVDKEVDYIEDFDTENGNYELTCVDCGTVFHGHKRRLICKRCQDKPRGTLNA